MDPSSTARSERLTALLSTLVAVAILAAGVTAQQSHQQPSDRIVQLESDLRFQLESSFRHDANERAQRLDQLEQVVKRWRQLPSHSAADRQRLADWLLEATIRSMPGSDDPLPAIPQFGLPSETIPKPRVEEPTSSNQQTLEESSASTWTKTVSTTPVATTTQPPTPTVSTLTVQPTTHQPTELLTANVPAPHRAAEEPAPINLTALATRIATYHDRLEAVEIRLLTLDSPDLAVLANQVQQLDEMTRDFRFVKLYHDALTESERRSLVTPRSMTATLEEIERLLDRSSSAPTDFLNELDAERQSQIEKLRHQLSAIADRVVW